jgi:hypothetical protein
VSPDSPSQLDRAQTAADFTYSMTVDVIKTQDTGKGAKWVATIWKRSCGRSKSGTKARLLAAGSVSLERKLPPPLIDVWHECACNAIIGSFRTGSFVHAP